ncbi:conserved hypothetical protein [Talaromyces stipitatus ATCC 10500]|uniref:Zn(2)-C6 fungal-type domain-containing protein n=1 Tax=Talaromyces stipitatus (strain ATCC 10500 / CBS 375.48 / QM 6759 / NRRL 1006) TaxID=441959 RepID=B8M4B5_TALSN|nr:uncharacterized protein TSTA_024350 [Talaromyces stipitatus ATCC 10500]EED19110.1 conserved hypothetical protein [Talaromyces stipitatus ATCC 10500]
MDTDASPAGTRPYRSKLKRPCDRCRTRKIACILPESGPCRNCMNVGKSCTFEKPPTPRNRDIRNNNTPNRSPNYSLSHVTGFDEPNEPTSFDKGGIDSFLFQTDSNNFHRRHQDHDSHTLPKINRKRSKLVRSYDLIFSSDTFKTQDAPKFQHIRSLDQLDASTAQVFGTSAESDPWLLRHCKYDDNGMLHLHGIHFRNVGGVPVEGLVPVHFLVTEDSLLEPLKEPTPVSTGMDVPKLRQELNRMIPLKFGVRLILLFMKFVYSMMPLISRSQIGLPGRLNEQSLQDVPVHLLAALYASALPFKIHDPELVLCGAYESQLCNKLWRIVYQLIMQEIHTPHLSVLQACLLYLQRLPVGSQSALADSPFIWSFLGTTVGLASSLGLHLEPRPWGIPAWEKRLRRRLWWAVYIEDKWRSLLIGRPPFIDREEWDVQNLDESDFVVNGLDEGVEHGLSHDRIEHGAIFRSFTKLAIIADNIHQTFYTLRASQKMCQDFRISINAARPIREELQAWYASLPDSLRIKQKPENSYQNTPHIEGVSSLHFAYLILELFVYRAILRPLARSPPPPPIADDKDPQNIAWLLEDLGCDGQGLDQLPVVDFSELGDAAEATLNAAEKCAGIIVNFVGAMTEVDFDTFWYPWTRISFATVSNFILLLLIQAPTAQHASRTKHLLDIWLQNLSCQYKNHENLMSLGLVRLSTLMADGLERNFNISSHVAEILTMDNTNGWPMQQSSG